MSDRTGSRLQSRGQDVIATPRSPPLANVDMEDLERSLDKRARGGAVEASRRSREPQTARALLEVNKALVEAKKEELAFKRQRSREFIETLLEGDEKKAQADKAKDASRRLAQQELAKYYKSKIAEKEEAKSQAYKNKVEAGAGGVYFPYVEGEHINQTRKAQQQLMRDEMRGFLQNKERALQSGSRTQTPRTAREKRDITPNVGEERQVRHGLDSSGLLGDKQPAFLKRPTEHMSRRIQDDHVRKALEDKVQRTKDELEALTRARQLEAQQWEEGMMVNDALRYDASQSKVLDRHKNAQFLKAQIEERKNKREREKQEYRANYVGYWGPEDKEAPDTSLHIQHNRQLIQQMEVNQNRRLHDRQRNLAQERQVIDNSLAEISQDRDAERQKFVLHREVLTTTWDSQQKIREVMNRIENVS